MDLEGLRYYFLFIGAWLNLVVLISVSYFFIKHLCVSLFAAIEKGLKEARKRNFLKPIRASCKRVG